MPGTPSTAPDPEVGAPGHPRDRSTWIPLVVTALAVLGIAMLAVDHVVARGRSAAPAGGLVLLAVAFAVAELCVVHMELGENAHSFTLAEIPIVIGLFFVAPWELVLARVLGGLAVMAWPLRRAPMKLAFNIALFLAEVSGDLLIFHALVSLGGATAWKWIGAVVAGQCMNALGAVAVWVAIGLTGGESDPLGRVLPLGAVSSSATVTVGLLAVEIAGRDPAALWMIGVVAAVLFATYRQFGALQRRHLSLRQVHEFTKLLSVSPELSSTIRVALEQAMRVLQAARAELCLFSLPGAWTNIRITYDGLELRTDHIEDLEQDDPLVNVVRDDRGPLLITGRQTDSEQGAILLASRDAQDLVACPLVSAGHVVGIFAVFDHLGDISTFRDDDVRVFETLANHVSISLEKARLIDELRIEVAEKEHQALHDTLTGLGNRAMFTETATDALRVSRAEGRQLAVLVMDLNRFKDINDTLGHHTGDILLRQLAERVRALLPPGATAARLGGDEFVFLLPTISTPDAATQTAERFLDALRTPFSIGGLELAVGAAVGIAFAPDHGDEPGVLLQHADIAMYACKEGGEGRPVTFSPDLDTTNRFRLSLGGELRTALDEHQLELHYQPVAEFTSGVVVGAEALLRWRHPQHGWISPEDIIPLAEHLGLIRPLTMWVLETAITQCKDWRDHGHDMQVAVNLAAQSLVDTNLANDIHSLLVVAGLDAAHIILEITETQVIRDPQQTIDVLNQLDRLGHTLAVDDFGTGYSSLSYLTRLPIGEIKIDKSFVQQMLTDPTSHKVVQSVVDLGASLGKTIVAEGVEDLLTWDALTAMGCDLAQGYYLSRPLPAGALQDWLPLRARQVATATTTTTATASSR